MSNAAESLGCVRSTVYDFINKYDDVKQVFDDINETTIDKVENKMMELIDEGNSTLIIFYLKTKAKHRGYVERQEHTGKDGEVMKIKHTHEIDYSQLSDEELRRRASGK